MKRTIMLLVVASLAFAGCRTGYSWKSGVPENLRTVCVPVFRNESDSTELGPLAARQILRELQREGTFRIARPDDAAVEIQGVIKSASSSFSGGSRKTGMRFADYRYTAAVEVSVVDRLSGRVLIDGRRYTAETVYAAGLDLSTSARNANGRLAEDLARQIVDDLLAVQW